MYDNLELSNKYIALIFPCTFPWQLYKIKNVYRSTTRTQINFVVNYIIYLYTQSELPHIIIISLCSYILTIILMRFFFWRARERLTLMHRNCVYAQCKQKNVTRLRTNTHTHARFLQSFYIYYWHAHTLVLMIYNIYSMRFNFILITFLWRDGAQHKCVLLDAVQRKRSGCNASASWQV